MSKKDQEKLKTTIAVVVILAILESVFAFVASDITYLPTWLVAVVCLGSIVICLGALFLYWIDFLG